MQLVSLISYRVMDCVDKRTILISVQTQKSNQDNITDEHQPRDYA